MTGKYQTMAEIEAAYDGEWVLIANPTYRRKWHQITGGVVAVHCADRLEYYRLLGEWDGTGVELSAVRFVGRFPEEVEVDSVEPELARQ